MPVQKVDAGQHAVESALSAARAAVAAYDSLPAPPPRAPSDRASYAALQASDRRRDGYQTPLGEYEAKYAMAADGTLARSGSRGLDLDAIWATIPFPLDLGRIPVPALAIYSLWEAPIEQMVPYFAWLDSTGQAKARGLSFDALPAQERRAD